MKPLWLAHKNEQITINHSIMKKHLTLLAALLLTLTAWAAEPVIPLYEKAAFDTIMDGQKVSLYTITNGTVTAQVTNYGAFLVGLFAPDRNGEYQNLVTSYPTIHQYPRYNLGMVGPSVGRFANRIANGTFTLDGQEYHITKNNGQHTLHGGTKGFDHVVWTVKSAAKDKVVMECVLPDGADGFPGNLTTVMTYAITKDNGLSITFESTTDKATVVNTTCHSYFNLDGVGNGDIMDYELQINADNITETDQANIPTGKLLSVEGTPYDFRKAVKLSERIAPMPQRPMMGQGGPRPQMGQGAPQGGQRAQGQGAPQGGQRAQGQGAQGGQGGNGPRPGGFGGFQPQPIPEGMVRQYDHNFCLTHTDKKKVEKVVSCYAPKSGRVMEVWNNHPGLQVYTGARTAIALESQMYPDSPNHPEFPSTTLRPGEKYSHTVVYKFSVKK